MSNVIPFTDHRGKTFYPDRREVEVDGKARKRWMVVTREAETKRRQKDEFLATNELWQIMMLIPVEQREITLMLLEADKRRRNAR
jgi:hypothetical protein